MKVYEEVPVPATTRRQLKLRKCDLCGKESGGRGDTEWDKGFYDVMETEVQIQLKMREGEAYPEGGWGTTAEIDICPECFRGKLIPWLQSEGADIKREEWDY